MQIESAPLNVYEQPSLFDASSLDQVAIDRQTLIRSLKAHLKDIELHDLVALLTNDFEEMIEYLRLVNGEKACQRTSLLFNPHRLATKTKTSKLSIYDALKTDNYLEGLARAILFKLSSNKTPLSTLLYFTVQLGVNGIQYCNEFPPHVARDLCKKYGLTASSRVLDPCAGWGGRMIGVSTVCNRYTCFEPASRTVDGLIKLNEFLQTFNNDLRIMIFKLPFEDQIFLEENSFDFALTSPPYYDTEEYSDEATNSMNRYGSFETWADLFYLPLISKTMYALKPRCSFVLNIGSRTYPLNELLINNFSKQYEIKKIKSGLMCEGGGLRCAEKEGETFYEVTK